MMALVLAAPAVAEQAVTPVPPPPPPMPASASTPMSETEGCADAVARALVELQGVVQVDPSDASRVADILSALCGSAPSQPAVAAPAAQPDESESTNILGIEIRKAPPGADGYERTRK
jgi:hypothetical protein